MSMYVAHAQNSFYYFRMVITYATFSLLTIAVFLESSKMFTANWIRGETVIIVKGDDQLSRLDA